MFGSRLSLFVIFLSMGRCFSHIPGKGCGIGVPFQVVTTQGIKDAKGLPGPCSIADETPALKSLNKLEDELIASENNTDIE